jgi:MraZ protein
MYYGRFEYAIDEKGRVNVPVKFRDLLRASGDDRLFLTNFITQNVRCLDIYPYSEWQKLEARVREKPQFDPNIINFFHNYYFAAAQDVTIDKQGRILVPPDLREYAGLTGNVLFTGAVDKFRLWDREAYKPVRAAGEQALIDNPNLLTGMGI